MLRFLKTDCLSIILLFVLIELCCADETKDTLSQSPIKIFLSKLKYPEKVSNVPSIDLSYGLSFPSFAAHIFKSTLAKAYPLELKYGFTRIDTLKPVPELLSYASEFAFIKDVSSHLKPRSWKKNGITQDNWSFGFGFVNGAGYNLQSSRLILYNAGRLVWSRIDFEQDADNQIDQDKINLYDVNYRFGTSFDMGMKLQVYSFLNVDFSYSHTVVFPRHLALKWMGSSGLELLMQRTIDYYEPELMNLELHNYPVINFLIKNAISIAFYEFRRNNMNWPFKSDAPFNYDSFICGISLIF